MLDLFIRLAQLTVHAIALREEGVSRTDDHWKKRRVEQGPAVYVQQDSLGASDDPNREQSDGCGSLAVDAKGKHRGREDKKRAGARVDGHKQNPEQHHSYDVCNGSRVLQGE